MNTIEKIQKRAQLLDEAREMHDKAGHEKRNFTKEEERRFDKCIEEAHLLSAEIEAEEVDLRLQTAQVTNDPDIRSFGGAPIFRGLSGIATRPLAPGEIRIYRKGEERVLAQDIRAKHPLPDDIRPEEVSLGRAIRAMITGDWTKADAEKRIMATSPGAQGGYLIPDSLSSEVIAMAINKMVVQQAGAAFTPMDTKKLTVPKVVAMPEPEWLPENEEGSFGDITFDKVDLGLKRLRYMLVCQWNWQRTRQI
jgi:HK97 family phage major capsid protein